MQQDYEVFANVKDYMKGREGRVAKAVAKAKAKQVETRLDLFYAMQERPEMKAYAATLAIIIDARESELADLHRTASR